MCRVLRIAIICQVGASRGPFVDPPPGRPCARASARGCAGDRFPMREVCGLAFAMTLIPPRDAGGQFRRADRDAWRAEGAPSFGLSRSVRAATAARMPSLNRNTRGAGAAAGIPSEWPKSPDKVRESCAAARPGLNEFRSPHRSLGSPRKVKLKKSR